MSRHRAEVRPRYGRIATLSGAVVVVMVAALGGLGALPTSEDGATRARDTNVAADVSAQTTSTEQEPAESSESSESSESPESPKSSQPSETSEPESTPSPEPPEAGNAPADDSGLQPIAPGADNALDEALPENSGAGYRVVYSESRQRTWLVAEDGTVERSYLVSGSVYDNLDPGTYEVYSRSEDAYGIDDSGTMKWFVRFTQGPSGAAIGFHDIPVDDGAKVQTTDQLGTPLSHGCIRQKTSDAKALWAFAPLGTTVVVTA